MLALLITVVIVLLVVGLVLYLMNLAPIDARIKQAIVAIVIVFVIIWLLMLVTGHGTYAPLWR